MRRHLLWFGILLSAALGVATEARNNPKCEVWAIDQSNSTGKTYGGTVYIWEGQDLENRHRAPTASADPANASYRPRLAGSEIAARPTSGRSARRRAKGSLRRFPSLQE